MKKLLKTLANNLAYTLIGVVLAISGGIVLAVNITVPQSAVQGSLPIGNSNGTYSNGSLVAGSNITINTSTPGQITITASNGASGAVANGINGYVTRYTGTSTIATGILLDNGTVSGVNATSSTASFNVQGTGVLSPLNVASSSGTSVLRVLANGNVGIASATPADTFSLVGSFNQNGAYSHFGTAQNKAGRCPSQTCLEVVGDDNTIAGVNIVLANNNSGTNAYNGLFLQNNSGDSTLTNYAGMFLNGSNYSTTTFGTAVAVGSQAQIVNTMGGIIIQAATSSTAGIIQLATGGLDTSNIRMTVTSAGLVGIGTTTPAQQLTLTGSIQGAQFSDAAKYLYLSKPLADFNIMRFVGSNQAVELQMNPSDVPNPYFRVARTDVARSFVNVLFELANTGGSDQVVNATGTSIALWVRNGVNGTQETDRRFQVKTNFSNAPAGGAGIVLGDGSGVGNANLYWSAADILKTDDALVVVGTSTLATTTISNLTVAQAPTVSAFSTGVVHSSSVGLLSSSAIVGSDIQNGTIDLTTKVTGVLPIANGGTATTTPTLIAGANITVSGTWPFQTITGSAGGSGNSAFTIGNGNIFNATSTDLVGIGTSSPTATLFVQGKGGTNPFAVASSTGTAMLTVGQGGSLSMTGSIAGTSFNSGPGAAEVFPGPATLTQGDMLYASGANTYSALAKDTNATRYLSNTGASNNPAWAQIDLSNGVTSVLPAANGGMGTTTLGDLLVGSNLSVSGGQKVLIGTTTTISLGTNVVTSVTTSTSGTVFTGSIAANNLALVFPDSPTFTKITSTNASTTNLSVATNAYLTNIASGNCLQTGTGGLITSAGAPCGTGGAGGNSAWTIGNALIYNATTTDSVLIGTTTPTTAKLYVVGSGTKTPLTVASSSGVSLLTVASNGSTTISSLGAGCVNSTATGDLFVASCAGGGTVTGTGLLGYGARWTSSSAIGQGALIDNGVVTGVNATSSQYSLLVQNLGSSNPFSAVRSVASGTIAYFRANGVNATDYGDIDIGNSTAGAIQSKIRVTRTNSPTAGDGKTDIYTKQGDLLALSISSEALVGISSSTPAAKLSVVGTSGSSTPLFIVASSTGAQALTVTSNGNVGIGSSVPASTLAVAGGITATGSYHAFGSVPITDTFYCNSATQCMYYAGNDNTNSGVNIEVQNTNSGANAYTFLTVGNNLLNSSGTYYSGVGVNSSGYNSTAFGTAIGVPNQLALQTNIGPITIVSATSTNGYINFLVGGGNVENEKMRLTTTGVGIGTTTPNASLVVQGTSSAPTVSPLVIASSSGTSFLTVASNGSTTLSTLGTGCVNAAAGSLYTAPCGGGSGTNYWTNSGNQIFNNVGYLVGINSSTPVANLSVSGSSTAPTIPIFVAASSTNVQVLGVNSNGTVGIGSSTPNATLAIRGVPGALAPLSVASSSGTSLLNVDVNGNVVAQGNLTLTAGGANLTMGNASTCSTLTVGSWTFQASGGCGPTGNWSSPSAVNFSTVPNGGNGGGGVGSRYNGITFSGSSGYFMDSGETAAVSIDGQVFNPSSGSAGFSSLFLLPVINQSGSANGTSSALYIRPVVTKAFNFKAIDIEAYIATTSNTTTLYEALFRAPTFASTSSHTLQNAQGIGISGAPKAGPNMTISSSSALTIAPGAVNGGGTVTKAYGAFINAPTGATTNYSGVFVGGNAGVGTSTPSFGFVNVGTAQFSGLTTAAGTPNSLCINATTKEITENAALTCTVSSRQFKQDINYLQGSYTDLIMQLKPTEFAYKDAPDRQRWGFIAEDVAEVDPKLADGYKDGKPTSLDQNAILAVAVKTIQEQEIRIKSLEDNQKNNQVPSSSKLPWLGLLGLLGLIAIIKKK